MAVEVAWFLLSAPFSFLGKVDDSNSHHLLRLSAPDAVYGSCLLLKPWRVELSPLLRLASVQVGGHLASDSC